MSTLARVPLDIALRSIALLVLAEGVAAIYSDSQPDDDGLGAGLTVMFLLLCAAAIWGLVDGFRRSSGRLCLIWSLTGVGVSVGLTLYSNLRYGDFSWTVLLSDLSTGLFFWAGLVALPAIGLGIVVTMTRERR